MINGHEPVAVRTAIVAVVAAVVHLLVLLKVIDLDTAAETAIVTTVDLIAGLAIILLVRPKVTPVAHPTLTVDQVATGTVYAGPDSSYELLPPSVDQPAGSFTVSPKPDSFTPQVE